MKLARAVLILLLLPALLAVPVAAATHPVSSFPTSPPTRLIGFLEQEDATSTKSPSSELVVVPDLTERSLREARALLQMNRLVLDVAEPVRNESLVIVVRQAPPAGARVPAGTRVHVVVAAKPQPPRSPSPPSSPPSALPDRAAPPRQAEEHRLKTTPDGQTSPPRPARATRPSPSLRTDATEAARVRREDEPARETGQVALIGKVAGAQVVGVDRDLLAVDRILRSLELANVAFNAPTTLWVRETAIIQLVLSMRHSIEDLQRTITAPGEKEGARVRISNEMEARLSGSGFKIEAITPEVQAVSASEPTEWKWEIEPTKVGSHHVHLTLSAHLQVEGQRVPRLIRTFERSIKVNVTWREKAGLFLAGNWQWLWTAILVPITAWVVRRWKRMSNVAKPSP
jgi:hypothetical protein